MTDNLLELAALLLGILTPLVAVPLTVITFYLRSIREQEQSWHADFQRRLDAIEVSLGTMQDRVCDFERDFTTKEEWLRECMLARRALERLSTAGIRAETVLKTLCADRGSRAEYVSDNCGRLAQRVADGNQSADTSGENE